MKTNFSTFLYQNSDNLHLKVFGDFDVLSVHELICIIKDLNWNPKNIFIHTSGLSSVNDFVLNEFKKKCGIENLSHFLTFTGEYGNALAPEGSRII